MLTRLLRREWLSISVMTLLLAALPRFVLAEGSPSQRAAIIVSEQIRPYLAALDGIKKEFAQAGRYSMLEYYLDEMPNKIQGKFAARLDEEKVELMIALGPAAAQFVGSSCQESKARKIYAMVLRPEQMPKQASPPCGVTLDLAPAVQLRAIACAFSKKTRIGVLYNPRFNKEFIDQLRLAAFALNLTIVAKEVEAKDEIPFALGQVLQQVDCLLFIPDPTVTHESLIQYIIHEAVLLKVPVVGYNRFFYDEGAALAFVLDYEVIGRQAARLALVDTADSPCEVQSPQYKVLRNLRVMEYLNISAGTSVCEAIEDGP